MAKIMLDVHVCATYVGSKLYSGHTFTATFAHESQAVEYIGRKSSTCAFYTRDDSPIDGYAKLMDTLYPTCEHGLSASLCMGPGHYPTDEQERATSIY